MKRLFSLLVLALSFSAIFAQQTTVALLNHEGAITTFYGQEALTQAHKAAVHGDVITLSGGSFTAPSSWIKAVTIRGAGCYAGDDNSREVTSIGNDFSLSIPAEIETTMVFEGISFKSNFNFSTRVRNTTFLKCYFTKSVNSICCNTNFYNCVLNTGAGFYGSNADYLANVNFFNCYVHEPSNHASYVIAKFINCVIYLRSCVYSGSTKYCGARHMDHAIYNNCILLGRANGDSNDFDIPSSCTATNCLSCYCAYKNATETTDAIYDYNIFDYMGNATNSYLEEGKPINETIKSVFKKYNGTDGFSFNDFYELTDEAKTKYIGTDGTQIGLHGGMGFDLVPSTLQITKCEVAPRSTTDGKLSVSIEVGIPE